MSEQPFAFRMEGLHGCIHSFYALSLVDMMGRPHKACCRNATEYLASPDIELVEVKPHNKGL